ncbi:MAG: methionyl-tRNA formyltransferase [Hyphomicrobiales bacterium]
MRIVFMGTPEFAVPTLTAIVGAGHEVVAAYARAPRPAGRGMAERPSPVEVAARRFAIPVLTPRTLRNDEAGEVFRAHCADVAVVVAYGLILPKSILEASALGCLNLHASLLPRWRGAAPIQRAVMAGDRETGVAIMRMEEGLDTGPVGLVERVPIGAETTAGELHDLMARLGADLMVRALAALSRGSLVFTPQPEEGVTYAAKIANEEARLDWRQPAAKLHDQVRGLAPFPGAFFEADLGKGKERIKVLRTSAVDAGGEPGTLTDQRATIACGSGALRLLTVQRAGRGPVSGEEFLRGVRLKPGARLA